MARRTTLLIASALAIAVVAAAAFWLSRPPAAEALTLQSAPLLRTLQFSGRVEARSRVEAGSTLTGRVAAVAVQEGDAVGAGQVLLRLDDAEWRAALAQAEAGERQAAARLAGLRAGGRDTAAAAVAQAQAQLAAAQAEQDRTRALVGQGFLSPARLDEATRALAVARAQLDAAQAQRSALGTAGSEIAQAEAALALARAGADAARTRLAQSVVRAPAGARVLQRLAEPGQIVQPGRVLLVLALDGPLELAAQVDERFLEELRVGQRAAVRADAFPQQRFDAVLDRIAPRVDAQRGSVELRFALPAPPDFLREDMTLSIEVTTAAREHARVLPLAALRGLPDAADAQAAEVWVADDGRVRARRVTLGLRTLQAVEVLDGLADGDAVLVGTAPPPGARVRPVATAANGMAGGQGAEAATAVMQTMGR